MRSEQKNGPLTREEFLRLFPWPAEARDGGEIYDFLWNYDISVTPEDLWDQIMDTSRLNREVGYGEVEYVEKNGLLHGAAGTGRFREEWVERPWEWVFPVWASRLRVYSKGFITFNLTTFYLQRTRDGQTRIYVYIGSYSKEKRAARLVPGYLRPFEDKYRRAFEKVAEGVRKNRAAADILSRSPVELAPAGEIRLRAARDELIAAGFEAPLVDALERFILEADRNDLARIRVVPLARRLDVSLSELLRLFLHGVRAGLFLLSWDVICPHCRGAREELPTLALVPAHSQCEVCAIEFENNREDSLEVTFRLHPAIGRAERIFFCSAETARKKHIKLQYSVPPGESRVETGLPPGDFRARLRGGRENLPLEFRKIVPGESRLPEMRAWFGVDNPEENPVVLTLEDVAWNRDFLRPSVVFNLPEFRDMFSEEHLATELQLDIGVQTLMFTDVVGSTAFYETQGDGPAFLEVKKLFQILSEAVRANAGVFVKTMGDGAMLAFPGARDALRAALAMQSTFHTGNSQALRVRISIHHGRCLAVNFNTGIDYFGRAVNLAAKLQQAAGPGEIVFSADFRAAPGIDEFLREAAVEDIGFDFEHNSFARPVRAFRVKG